MVNFHAGDTVYIKGQKRVPFTLRHKDSDCWYAFYFQDNELKEAYLPECIIEEPYRG